jgi:tRNA A-37 threonylcarbamoyl transferase component Bud32
MMVPDAQSTLVLLNCSLAALAITAIAYRLNKLVEKDWLVAEKNGIELPTWLDTAYSGRHVPWNSIARVEALLADPNRARIAFHMGTRGTRILDCSRLTTAEVEQLILAIQLWAAPEAVDATISHLQESIRPEALLEEKKQHGPSYTALWEDELRRRFRPVSFLPLEPDTFIRTGLKVVRQLAMGNLSAIYLCQLNGNDLVVVKEAVTPLDSPQALKEKAAELFDREAKILMKLSHPQIVKVLDHFVVNGRDYMMLEYASGQDLRQHVIQNGPLRETVAVAWAKEIASILEYLHSRELPIIHRDLTPDNIVMREDGKIVVIDFGAANEFIGNATGTFVGKQCYVAPEQFRGKPEPASDIYSFGATLFFLLTSRDPEALSISRPKQFCSATSAGMDTLVADCTALAVEKRIHDAAQLLERIEALQR